MNESNETAATFPRLTRAWLLKSLLEVVVVCVAITTAAFAFFNPMVRGAITQADAVSVRGWVSNTRSTTSVQLQLFIDNRFASASQLGSEGQFTFSYPPLAAGTHTAQVYLVNDGFGRAFALIPIARRPATFTVAR